MKPGSALTHTNVPNCSLSRPLGIWAVASPWIPGPACLQTSGGSLPPPERPSGTLAQTLLEVGQEENGCDLEICHVAEIFFQLMSVLSAVIGGAHSCVCL